MGGPFDYSSEGAKHGITVDQKIATSKQNRKTIGNYKVFRMKAIGKIMCDHTKLNAFEFEERYGLTSQM